MGIDIGLTNVKLVLLDKNNEIIYGKYPRHHAKTHKALSELLEAEGAEVVVSDLMDFLNYSVFGSQYKHKFLGIS